MKILAIDPGPEYTAFVFVNGLVIGARGWTKNENVLRHLREGSPRADLAKDITIIESPQAQDRPLGKLLRDTILWTGRYIEALDRRLEAYREVDERDVALWLTGNRGANNGAVLQSLKDHFGDTQEKPCYNCDATGRVAGVRTTKNCPSCGGKKFLKIPGPLAGLNEHERSCVAAAVYWQRREVNGLLRKEA